MIVTKKGKSPPRDYDTKWTLSRMQTDKSGNVTELPTQGNIIANYRPPTMKQRLLTPDAATNPNYLYFLASQSVQPDVRAKFFPNNTYDSDKKKPTNTDRIAQTAFSILHSSPAKHGKSGAKALTGKDLAAVTQLMSPAVIAGFVARAAAAEAEKADSDLRHLCHADDEEEETKGDGDAGEDTHTHTGDDDDGGWSDVELEDVASSPEPPPPASPSPEPLHDQPGVLALLQQHMIPDLANIAYSMWYCPEIELDALARDVEAASEELKLQLRGHPERSEAQLQIDTNCRLLAVMLELGHDYGSTITEGQFFAARMQLIQARNDMRAEFRGECLQQRRELVDIFMKTRIKALADASRTRRVYNAIITRDHRSLHPLSLTLVRTVCVSCRCRRGGSCSRSRGASRPRRRRGGGTGCTR
jgi:hypothetical protein